jgi:hypothetical protein
LVPIRIFHFVPVAISTQGATEWISASCHYTTE